MNNAITASDLTQGLHRLGVQLGMALEVHCSLSHFGHLEGGVDTVINTLMQEVGTAGALVMPSFRLSPNLPLTEEDRQLGLTTKIRILSENEAHSAMGIVADSFRKRPDVLTGNGIFRVSAWGKMLTSIPLDSSTSSTMMDMLFFLWLIFTSYPPCTMLRMCCLMKSAIDLSPPMKLGLNIPRINGRFRPGYRM